MLGFADVLWHNSTMENEEWRTAPDYLKYSVSNLGRVRRDVGGRGAAQAGRILKPAYYDGYPKVKLWNDNGSKYISIHALVAAAFIGPRPHRHEVAHYNGQRDDNRLENLRYATGSENWSDRRRHGRVNCGTKNTRSTLTAENVIEIHRLRKRGWKHKDIAALFGIKRNTCTKILLGKSWKHAAEIERHRADIAMLEDAA